MKIGELFISLGVIGDTKKLEKANKQLKEAEKSSSRRIKYLKDLKKAETDEEKALIKQNYQQKEQIDKNEKLINGRKEFNKALIAGAKGFTAFVAGASLAVGVLDRFINSSAKANNSVLTLSKTSGVDVDVINKYASAALSKNSQASREDIAQTMGRISQRLFALRYGDTSMITALNKLVPAGGRTFNPVGLDTIQFIEKVRDAIKGVDDVTATNVIQELGFNASDIYWLQMSRKELENIKNVYPDEFKTKELEIQARKINEVKQELATIFQGFLTDGGAEAIQKIFETFRDLLVQNQDEITHLIEDLKGITDWIVENKGLLKGLIVMFGLMYAYLNPVVTLVGLLIAGITKLKKMYNEGGWFKDFWDLANKEFVFKNAPVATSAPINTNSYSNSYRNSNRTFNQTNTINLNTTENGGTLVGSTVKALSIQKANELSNQHAKDFNYTISKITP